MGKLNTNYFVRIIIDKLNYEINKTKLKPFMKRCESGTRK